MSVALQVEYLMMVQINSFLISNEKKKRILVIIDVLMRSEILELQNRVAQNYVTL